MPDRPTREELAAKVRDLTATVGDLAHKQQFFQALLRSLPGVVYVFDENLQLKFWNTNAETITGYSPEVVSEMDLLNLFLEPDRGAMQEAIRGVFEEGAGFIESTLVTMEGRRIPFFFTGRRVTIDGADYLVGMGLDMTQLKTAEGELKETETLYRILAERITDGVMLLRGNAILFANQAFASLFDYRDTASFMAENPLELAAGGFTMYFREMYEALEAGVCEERFFQARWRTPKGREFWVEGRGNRIMWHGRPSVLLSARDITEAKLREISMQEESEQLRRENVTLRSSIKDRYRFGNIIGKSTAMQRIYELILNAAATSANVIIYGESGTGKELVARAIHEMSSRAEKSFVAVNCAAMPENLLESEFFGHKKGAFTGAHTDKQGLLDMADNGTLFLDEVGELTPVLQVKLLRAIEGGGYAPVGSAVTKTSDFRIISATNRNLLEESRKGSMREDFFFRIHIIPITLPPLRERKDDIPLLVEQFLRLYSGEKKPPSLPGQVLESLVRYDWPGNVRELQNVIQRYLTVKRLDFLSPAAPASADAAARSAQGQADKDDLDLRGATEGVERSVIREALEQNRWNKSRTAEALGVSRKTLFRKMKRLGLK
ncbi:sigma 54-interacting transcriptional regulator [bacterium]|nr:sigma 54-interacting transcriptional regulator [bacterium]